MNANFENTVERPLRACLNEEMIAAKLPVPASRLFDWQVPAAPVRATASETPRPQQMPKPVAAHRVLVPTDFSDTSSRAIRQAHKLAEQLRGELIVLYVALPLKDHGASLNEKEARLRAKNLYRRAETMLGDQMRETIGTGGKTPVHTVICEGYAYECIVEEAERNGADIIVIGKHGHSDDRSLLLGPTVESVIRNAGCPVLLLGN